MRSPVKNITLGFLVLLLLTAGCATPELIPTWALQGLDTRTEANGSVVVLDNRANWRVLSAVLQREVSLESKGMDPPAAVETWPEFWRLTLTKMYAGQEHPEKYFAYLVDQRRRLELPDLPKDILKAKPEVSP